MWLRRLLIAPTFLLLVACGNGPSASSNPDGCDRPSAAGGASNELAAPYMVIRGSEVRRTERSRGVTVVVLDAPVSIDEALEAYKKHFLPGYAVLNEDYEGFEAELYLKKEGGVRFLALQFLRSDCEGVSLVIITSGRVVPPPGPATSNSPS